ncbi:YfcC family protein [Viridibacillus sp. FSL R5-0477]|uniref:C4-dicarboxylate anaerobic carrier n=1 Tax=Viridibacillus arenosi FSL R5-213 TaxID=1227360 RepID=W4F095_9BACL|nr:MULTISPECIES: YfcC family protein [Viridibacillus]ETT86273.1 C4-dicarboxylate anaerobic carrier [Viridibacillus arenosi FSL R5-213]OMC85830.1 C4-dicarboxylate ABC transporter permease [Viridibacillus sp. FSL H7-0596]OMC91874.1 C4-dicarboxylate ABC transporter permease [Viridibacillus arenosi]
MEMQTEKKGRFRVPHVYVILFSVIIIGAICTYIIPAGEFDRIEQDGRTIVVPGSYHEIPENRTTILNVFESIHKGMIATAPLIFYIFIVGGAFGILRATGAIEGAVHSMAKKIAGREQLLIPVLMTFFALSGAMLGLAEETIPYITILIPLAVLIGFDSMVGTAIVLLGTSAGFTAAFMNPFTVGIAQGIAELPIFSGMYLRIIFFVIFLTVSIWYVMRYANKIKKNPKASVMFGEKNALIDSSDSNQTFPFTTRHKLAFFVLLGTLVGLAVGVIKFEWGLTQMTGLFLIMGILIGLVSKMNFSSMAEAFIKGCEVLIMGALVVGIANAILIILREGLIMDTILYGLASAVDSLPPQLAALGMYIVQCLVNYIVPSGSGQAALTMPIMVPLSDLLGVTRQTAVLAFQFGDGISNIFTPTSGYFMAGLALGGISWIKWVKWIWPLIVIHYVLGAIFVTIAQLINYQ